MTKFTFIPNSVRFFKNLHMPRTIKNMQYLYRGKAIVYGIRCQVDNMVYIGSSLVPGRRFDNHLVTGKYSNTALQQAIQTHGLPQFTAYVFEEVKFPTNLTLNDKLKLLHQKEQYYMNMFPKAQLYNSIASSI
jgi:group I intron endonuclease